jgi:hypothetical protein
MRSTAELRRVWAPACRLTPARRLVFWTGVPVTIDGRASRAFAALDAIMQRHLYRPRAGQTWGYNCRRITGGTGYSLHAYGIAVDVNSLANPYGRRLVTDMPTAMIDQVRALRTNGGHPVLRWGGDYSGNKDAMHFEVVASPAELATGIAGPIRTAALDPNPPDDDRSPDVILLRSKSAPHTTLLVGGGKPASIHTPDDVDALTKAGVPIANVDQVMVDRLIRGEVF